MRGWASDSAAAIEEIETFRDDPSTTGAQFLASIGAHELAMRTGRYADALAATETELGYVHLFVPAWENGTRYRQAGALRGLGRLDEAAEAVEESLSLAPVGADGLRWRLRSQALQLRIAHAQDGSWNKAGAENLTDVLLHANWYGTAAELMAYRADVEKDHVLAADTAALAMCLWGPITAAAATSATHLRRRVLRPWLEPCSPCRPGFLRSGTSRGGRYRESRRHSISKHRPVTRRPTGTPNSTSGWITRALPTKTLSSARPSGDLAAWRGVAHSREAWDRLGDNGAFVAGGAPRRAPQLWLGSASLQGNTNVGRRFSGPPPIRTV